MAGKKRHFIVTRVSGSQDFTPTNALPSTIQRRSIDRYVLALIFISSVLIENLEKVEVIRQYLA